MSCKKLCIYLFSVVLFSFSQSSIYAQNKDKPIDMSDVLTIKSPSAKFKDIHIQTHKGLPRFGYHNQYRFINKYGNLDLDRQKNTLLKEGHQNYNNMLKMKYIANYYNDIDKVALTVITHENRDDKKDIHSSTAQIHLLQLARSLGSDDLKRTYFCNEEKDPKCKSFGSWGGNRDEFLAQEKYAAFVADNLEDLRKWSTAFFENDNKTGYFVVRHKFGQYDFDKGGFWVQLPPHNKRFDGFSRSDDAYFLEFLPKEPFENQYLSNIETTFPKILLPIAADKAEDFLNNREINFGDRRPSEYIYSAVKVRIIFKELETSNITFPNATFTYQFVDSTIEFFKDIALTKKIGEISLKNPVYNK